MCGGAIISAFKSFSSSCRRTPNSEDLWVSSDSISDSNANISDERGVLNRANRKRKQHEWKHRGIRKRKQHECRYRGTYKSAEDAARAYDREAFKIKGANAKLNFPKTEQLPSLDNGLNLKDSTQKYLEYLEEVLELKPEMPSQTACVESPCSSAVPHEGRSSTSHCDIARLLDFNEFEEEEKSVFSVEDDEWALNSYRDAELLGMNQLGNMDSPLQSQSLYVMDNNGLWVGL